jgi:hypothetical protein
MNIRSLRRFLVSFVFQIKTSDANKCVDILEGRNTVDDIPDLVANADA